MAGIDFSGLLGRQKREISRMISDHPPEPKRRKVQDFEAPPTTNVPEVNVPEVLLRKDGDLSLENRNKRMFKQIVGTLEIEDVIVEVDEVKDAAKNDSVGEETVMDVNASHDDRSNTRPRRFGDRTPRMEDSKTPPCLHVSRVLQKHEDPSLVNRNKRMFRQLLGILEADKVAEYQPVPKRRAVVKVVDDNELKDDRNKDSVVDESVVGVDASHTERTATWPRNEVEPPIDYAPAESLGADVPLIERRKEQTREKAHEESERLRQNTNEQIPENERDLTVSTHVAATAGEDLKVHHNKLRRIYRMKAEPPINYSFAKSPGADIPLIEHWNVQGVAQVGRKTNFVHFKKISGKEINVLQGLELYTNVFGPDNQTEIVDCIYELQRRGRNGQLRGRTYSEPKKWMQGKGRITIQFGCCYNYATDRDGNPPGVLRNEEVEPLPSLFKEMIKKMVREHIIPPTCVPDSCIVNIYEVGDCIPPHIDHHDFLRPFCTVSFLTECNILFGSNLEIVGAGKFKGPVSIPLPVGSVLIINGNGADIAKHCVPSVHGKRISITFRKMDKSKLPYNILPDPELVGISRQL